MKMKLAIAIGVAGSGLLAGCGSSGQPGATMPPPVALDAFTQAVQGVVATSSDTAAPMAIDGISATEADGAQPIGI